MIGHLSSWKQPSWWSSASSYDDPTAFEFAHVSPIHFQSVHTRSRYVFFSSKHLVKHQLPNLVASLPFFHLKNSSTPEEILKVHAILERFD